MTLKTDLCYNNVFSTSSNGDDNIYGLLLRLAVRLESLRQPRLPPLEVHTYGGAFGVCVVSPNSIVGGRPFPNRRRTRKIKTKSVLKCLRYVSR